MNLPQHDQRHLEAAEGWLELGNVQEAHNELEEISFANRTCNEVLEMRVRLYALAGKWEHVVEIAGTLASILPEKSFGHVHLGHALRQLKRHSEALEVLAPAAYQFPDHWKLAFETACAICQTGDLKSAAVWLKQAFDHAGDEDVRTKALDEPDLEPIWKNIADT